MINDGYHPRLEDDNRHHSTDENMCKGPRLHVSKENSIHGYLSLRPNVQYKFNVQFLFTSMLKVKRVGISSIEQPDSRDYKGILKNCKRFVYS